MDENKQQEVKVDTRKVIKISKKKFVFGIIAIVILAIIILFSMSGGGNFYFHDIISLLSFIMPILIIIPVILFIWGLIQYFSTADATVQQKARPKIVGGIIAGIILIVLWGIVGVMGNSFEIGARSSNEIVPYIPNTSVQEGILNAKMMNSLSPSDIYYREDNQPSISDTREFLKTNYSANIKTRKVQDVTTEVKNIVKGADGRVDSISSNEKRGYISFVVPKSKFEAFKNEIEKITHKKLFTENESSQNLLIQKQGIEEQTTNIVNTLSNLKSQKEALNTKHTQTVTTINKELARIKNELTTLRTIIATTTEPTSLSSLRIQETSYIQKDSTQRKKLSDENSNYVIQSQNLDNSISNYNNNLANISKQDSQFTDNIETVNGSVSVEWINLWQLARVFSPIPPLLVILILVILAWIYLSRKNYIPRVEFQ
jgi:hypothetical protein